MSLAKSSTNLQYEETPVSTKPSKVAIKKAGTQVLNNFSTPRLLWHIVKRHKVALLALGNIVLVLNWAVPEWTAIVLGLLGH